MATVVWWIRRDLRLTDNETLFQAVETGAKVVPVFFVDPVFEKSAYVGEKRRSYLWQNLEKLNESLQVLGSGLIVRHGDPVALLPAFVDEVGATAVFAEEDYSPYAIRRDAKLKERLPLTLVHGVTYHHPADILKKDGAPYTVFTPFKRRWLERPLPHKNQLRPKPAQLSSVCHIPTDPIPVSDTVNSCFPVGEAAALRQLEAFANGPIECYAERRNLPAVAGTSRLSPALRFGLISPRQAIFTAVKAHATAVGDTAKDSAQSWLNELIWREFYIMIMYHFPFVIKHNFRHEYDQINWRNDPADFEAWCQGNTGYPIVDAAMRQLKQTGWMHNRARMIVASFLVKDLLIDWRWGERWFMQNLIDGDPAANNGGWQWSAGTGTDAAPYFRIFNPTTQSQKFDSQGTYIRHFVPELANYPDKEIHEPSKVSPQLQQSYGCLIGRDYPAPIVNHKEARLQTLAAYKAAKSRE